MGHGTLVRGGLLRAHASHDRSSRPGRRPPIRCVGASKSVDDLSAHAALGRTLRSPPVRFASFEIRSGYVAPATFIPTFSSPSTLRGVVVVVVVAEPSEFQSLRMAKALSGRIVGHRSDQSQPGPDLSDATVQLLSVLVSASGHGSVQHLSVSSAVAIVVGSGIPRRRRRVDAESRFLVGQLLVVSRSERRRRRRWRR